MERFSVREAVEMALRTEKLGYEFYTRMADTFREKSELRDLFVKLAGMERRHEEVFRGLLSSVQEEETEGWEEAGNYFRAMMESEFFLGREKSLPSLSRASTALEALNFAIGFEKETLLFFVGLKQAVREKDVVEEIIREEAGHIRSLSGFRKGLGG